MLSSVPHHRLHKWRRSRQESQDFQFQEALHHHHLLHDQRKRKITTVTKLLVLPVSFLENGRDNNNNVFIHKIEKKIYFLSKVREVYAIN